MEQTDEHLMPGEWRNFVRKPAAFNLIEDLMYACLIYPVAVLFLFFFDKGAAVYLKPFIFIAGMLALTLCRWAIKSMALFLTAELFIAAAVVLFCTGTAPRIFFGALILLAANATLNRYLADIQRAAPSPGYPGKPSYNLYYDVRFIALGALGVYVTYLVGAGFHVTGFSIVCMASLALLLAIYALYRHFSGTIALIGGLATYWGMHRIQGLNLLFTACAAIATGLMALAAFRLYYLTGLSILDQWIISLVTIGQHINPGQAGPVTNQPSQQAAGNASAGSAITRTASSLLGPILKFIMMAAAAAALIMLLILLLRMFMQFLRVKKGDEEIQSVFSARDVAGRLITVLKRVRYTIPGDSNSVKIRRIYYRFIRRHLKKGLVIRPGDAPADIAQRIQTRADMHTVTEIYERARYGPEDCPPGDVDAIKSIIGR